MKKNAATIELPPPGSWTVFQMSSRKLRCVAFVLLCILAQTAFPQRSVGQAPVYEITPVESSIKFDVESSVAIKGTFSKWNATLTFQTRSS